MAIQLKFALLVLGLTIGSFISVVSATAGTATFHFDIKLTMCLNGGGYIPSACFGYEDQGVMTAAASDALWDNGAACGRMYSVTCTGLTNQGVPEPCTGTLDIAQEAFSQIADPAAGKITIEYNE
ncbi:hypothetical protein CIPAW_08G133800 [Carya illinoinensis]|uniref:Expansin-like EG45 domain-containing protein n=1 Tax=Carya illinoinensis TaxID=32201 RepID=A0A8T1PW29_CARIL|nr:hypothetical protein CIPAW_08G133800 [Carya illinoinensis]